MFYHFLLAKGIHFFSNFLSINHKINLFFFLIHLSILPLLIYIIDTNIIHQFKSIFHYCFQTKYILLDLQFQLINSKLF
jgi:hypothetical protein